MFQEMAEEQRTSMDVQGVKVTLKRGLGADGARRTGSSDTPGFGVDTPSFNGAASGRSSADASAAASVMSSNAASPKHGGQMSPWILEAEALIEGDDEDAVDEAERLLGGNPAAAWGIGPQDAFVTPASLPPGCVEASFPGSPDAADASADSDVLRPLEEDDELTKVDLFVSVAATEQAEPCSPVESTEQPLAPQRAQSFGGEVHGTPSSASEKGVRSRPARGGRPCECMPGESVKYWSSSKKAWLPAVVVERRSPTLYVIDKQMTGCFSKVKRSELISQADQANDRFLRAMDMLESASDGEERSRRRRSVGAAPRGPPGRPRNAPSGRASSTSPRSAAAAQRALAMFAGGAGDDGLEDLDPPRATSQHARRTGRIVRDDFSSSSDSDGQSVGSARRAQRALVLLAGDAGGDGGLEGQDPHRDTSRTPLRTGRIVRNDFSSSSDSEGHGGGGNRIHSQVAPAARVAGPKRTPAAAPRPAQMAASRHCGRPAMPAEVAAAASGARAAGGSVGSNGGRGTGSCSVTASAWRAAPAAHTGTPGGGGKAATWAGTSLSQTPRRGHVVRHDISSDSD